ncbi:MAG: hypothetical protein J2P57_05530 [Acidimicrobiaceae bacterium]|nr:hypothetical protein [Acidimicrobiaceae bacterium]
MADSAAGEAVRALQRAEREATEAHWRTERTDGFLARRKVRKEESAAHQRLEVAKDRWEQVGEATLARLDGEIGRHRARLDELVAERERRAAYRAAHPELARRADALWGHLRLLDASVSCQRYELDGITLPTPEQGAQRARLEAQLGARPRVDQGPHLRHGIGMGP